ncbi:MAG: peptidase MA family metallohydrolase [Kofleriaceae bacterium]
MIARSHRGALAAVRSKARGLGAGLLLVVALVLGAPQSALASSAAMSAAPSASMSAAPNASMSAAPSAERGPRAQPVPAPGASMSAAPPVTRAPRAQPTPAPAWLDATAVAGPVVVRSPAALARVGRRLAAAAAGALQRIATDLPDLPTPGTIEVRLVDDASELASVAPSGRGAPAYAIGLAYPDLGVVSIATRRGARYEDPEATLRHELAHMALGAAIPRAPRWLHEGFAYQHSAEWSWERTETLAGMVWFHSIVPLSELDRSFPAEELATHRAYAESYDFVGFLSRRGRWADKDDDGDRYPFRRFLAALSTGATLDDAAVSAFGRPIQDLFNEWRDELSDRLMFAPVGLFALSIWLLAAILLVLGWRRRQRQARATLDRWAREEAARPSPSVDFDQGYDVGGAGEANARPYDAGATDASAPTRARRPDDEPDPPELDPDSLRWN